MIHEDEAGQHSARAAVRHVGRGAARVVLRPRPQARGARRSEDVRGEADLRGQRGAPHRAGQRAHHRRQARRDVDSAALGAGYWMPVLIRRASVRAADHPRDNRRMPACQSLRSRATASSFDVPFTNTNAGPASIVRAADHSLDDAECPRAGRDLERLCRCLEWIQTRREAPR